MTPQTDKFLFTNKKWIIRKYNSDEDAALERDCIEEIIINGNLALNEGIDEVAYLIAEIGTPTGFGSAHAYIGVGDSSTAASASQTGLQAVSNKTYKAMDATYPQYSSQVLKWRSTFGTGDANYDWNEVTVANGSSDSAANLNRKVGYIGTKTSANAWVIELQITLG